MIKPEAGSFAFCVLISLFILFAGSTGAMTPTPTPSCIPEWCWLDRDLPETAVPGEAFTVRFNIQGGTASITMVSETVPEGWEILSPEPDYHSGIQYEWYYWITEYTILPPADAEAGTYYFFGETQSYHWCNGNFWRSIGGDFTLEILNGPDLTPTATPSPTPTGENTPLPCQVMTVDIEMPAEIFYPGDPFYCHVTVDNCYPDDSFPDTPLFFILEIYGRFFMGPGFGEYDFYEYDFPAQQMQTFVMIPEFSWPTGLGSSGHACFYSALTTPDRNTLISSVGYKSFRWIE